MVREVLGVVGALMILGAYFSLVTERMRETEPAYLGLNILGSALILASLAQEFNFGATLMQAGWIVITLAGAIGRRRSRG